MRPSAVVARFVLQAKVAKLSASALGLRPMRKVWVVIHIVSLLHCKMQKKFPKEANLQRHSTSPICLSEAVYLN